jgi:AhpD family alkylhydroperoxidase
MLRIRTRILEILFEENMSNRLDKFPSYRNRMNGRTSEIDHLDIKRFFNLDSMAYKDAALSAREKGLLGLVASMVLHCNACIDYHILPCLEAGWQDEQLYEAFNMSLVVGGSIVIPHRRPPLFFDKFKIKNLALFLERQVFYVKL